VTGVVSGDISALVVKVDGTAGALAEDGTAGAPPLAAAEGEAEGAGDGAHGFVNGAVIQGVGGVTNDGRRAGGVKDGVNEVVQSAQGLLSRGYE
jgi:hypothetical protein